MTNFEPDPKTPSDRHLRTAFGADGRGVGLLELALFRMGGRVAPS
jgi:hypothetical protein